jgi:hypothetical protein
MNKMTGIIVMVIGFLILVIGIVIFFNSNEKEETVIENGNELEKVIEMAIADGVLTNNEKSVIKQLTTEKGLDYDEIIADAENRISALDTDSETELINYNKKNGDDFEKFIVQKFDKKYFSIKEWAGDKYIKGNYAKTTSQPDLLLEFKLREKSSELSVECKWRKNYYKNGVEFAKKEQLERYKEFQKEKNIPVFIAIGIGGKGMSPEQFYIIPLQEINKNFLSMSELKKYEKKIGSNFFFDSETNQLK